MAKMVGVWTVRSILSVVFCSLMILTVGPGPAQAWVPPHLPGTVCYTPQFWCWTGPHLVGQPCLCPTPAGPIAGFAG
jgi:hypothetical protein